MSDGGIIKLKHIYVEIRVGGTFDSERRNVGGGDKKIRRSLLGHISHISEQFMTNSLRRVAGVLEKSC